MKKDRFKLLIEIIRFLKQSDSFSKGVVDESR